MRVDAAPALLSRELRWDMLVLQRVRRRIEGQRGYS